MAEFGQIRGRLLRVGGPLGAGIVPLSGTVSIPSTVNDDASIVLTVAADGRFSANVEPGNYVIEGRSPRVTSTVDDGPRVPIPGVGRTQSGVPTTRDSPIRVEAGDTLVVDVRIQIR